MAVDTANKRAALMGLHSPVPRRLPSPSGGFNTNAERRMLLFGYPLIVTTAATAPLQFCGQALTSTIGEDEALAIGVG